MKKILALAFLLSAFCCNAQTEKVNIYAGYTYGSFMGSSSGFNSNGDVYMYSNMGALHGATARVDFPIGNQWRFGVDCGFQQSNRWDSSKESIFNGTYVRQFYISPSLVKYWSLAGTDFLKRFKIVGDISPVLGYSTIKVKEVMLLMDLMPGDAPFPIYGRSTINHVYYGIGAGAGVDYSLTESLGVFARYNISVTSFSKDRVADDHFVLGKLSVGFFYQL